MKSKLLTPDALDHLKNLRLVAARVVEGFMSGLHTSPYHGFSVEFAEYREYMPGDDLRFFEWKALGKSDRSYIKKFQSETNMRVQLLLDVSGSMGYASGKVTKLRWGAALAACLTHLLIHQQDAVGLTTFSDRIDHFLPPGRGERHMHQVFSLLESAAPGRHTSMAHLLHRTAETLPHRGMVILISDLLEDPEPVLTGLQHIAFKGHEIIVFQVLDPWERAFPFTGLCEFMDMETQERMQVQPEVVGQAVREELDRFIGDLHQALLRRSIDHREAVTDQPFDRFLSHYLHLRTRRF